MGADPRLDNLLRHYLPRVTNERERYLEALYRAYAARHRPDGTGPGAAAKVAQTVGGQVIKQAATVSKVNPALALLAEVVLRGAALAHGNAGVCRMLEGHIEVLERLSLPL